MTKQITQFFAMLLFVLLGLGGTTRAQTFTLNTTTGSTPVFTNSNGSGTVTFNFENNSGGPIKITAIEGVTGTAGSQSAALWIKTSGPINGAPGAISVANGWTLAASGTFVGVSNTTTTVTQTFLSGLAVTIPAGANYGMAVSAYNGTTGTQRYYFTGTTMPTTTFTAGGCSIITGNSIGYGGGAPPTAPANTPRGWIGKIIFEPFGPCTDPPTPGTVTTTASAPCPNTPFTLNIIGGTGGIGQTYQWESSPDDITYTPVPGGNSPQLITSQTSSNYYHCLITCGASTVSTASILCTTVGSPLSGNYTIDNNTPTGGTNYASFTAFVNDLNCLGVSGPVTVDVVAGSGPYNEQIRINQFPGSSATNTLTINGNGTTISFNSADANNPSTIELNGADYVSINNLNVTGLGATYAFAMHAWNNADNNNFTNCTFSSPANGTSTTQVPFSISGSQTSATTSGPSGSNNVVTGCTMNSGYYNTCFVGNSASPNTGNQLINCNIRDQYFYGSYNLYQNGMIIRGNTIERPNRTTLSTFYGIYLTTGCTAMLVEKNKIRKPFGAAPTNTGTVYSIYVAIDGTSGNENRIINNLVSDMQGNGTMYGLYLVGADYVSAYHNTISFDQTTATGTTTTYGIYSSGTVGGIDIKNNIVSISRGGTGNKWGLYYTTTFALSDYNVVNMSAAATHYFGFYSAANQATKAAFNTASGKDGNTVEANPNFADPGLGDYTPTNVSVNNTGTPIATVTDDINGNPRSVTQPDAGAIEFTLNTTDCSFQSISSPVAGQGCYTSNDVVTAVIKNSGIDPIDFSLNPVTINVTVSGPAFYTVTETINFGTLGVGQSLSVPLNPSVDLTVDGIYTITGNVSMLGDMNINNDNLATPVTLNVGILPGTITMNLNNPICVSFPPSFTLSGQYGGTKQWQMSTVSATGPWTNVGSGGNTYSPGVLTQDYWVQVESNCNTNYAYTNVIAVTVNNPTMASTTDGVRCGTGTVDLAATANGSATVNWYANATGGIPLATGTNTFTTPTIASTTTYYAAPAFGLGVQTVNGGNTWNQYTTVGSFQSTLISGAVMIFNVTTPTTISSLDIYPSSAVGTAFTIEVRQTNSSGALVASYSGVTTVQNSGTPSVAQTVPCNLVIPAGSNYVIGFSGANPGCWRGNVTNFPYPFSFPGVIDITASSASGTSTAPTAIYQYYFYNWKVLSGCEGVRSPVLATVNTAPSIAATGPGQICDGQTATLDVTSPNDPFYEYTWTPGNLTGANQTVTPTVNTTYTVTAYDPNTLCQLFATVPVVVNTNPTLSGITATPSSVNPGCNTAVSLEATTSAPTNILIGNASTALTTSGNAITPYSSFYESTRLQYLFTAAELTSLGFSAGTISSIGFDVTATSAFNQTGYTIKMGHTAATALTGYATIIGSLQTVYGPVLLTPPTVGINTFPFSSTFNWNGTDNIIIEICHDNDNAANTCGICYGTAGTVKYTNTAFNSTYGTYNDNSTLCGTGVGTLTANTTNRPNMYLNGIAGQPTDKVWTPGSLTGSPVSVTPTATSTYTVTCTNATTGCTTSGSVTVTMNANADLTGLSASYLTTDAAVTMTGTPAGGVFSGPGVTGSTFDPATAGVGTHTITYLPTGYCVPASVTVIVNPAQALVPVKCFLQGFYLGSGTMQPVLNNQGMSNPTTDCDDVTVELHDATAPYATAYTYTGVLQTDGTVNCIFPAGAVGGSYYLVVLQRNHIQTWSANPITIASSTPTYDFSTAANKAYGDNQWEVETGVFGFYAGDVNQDLTVDGFDYIDMDPNIVAGDCGYYATDLTGDGCVDVFDFLMASPNIDAGITIQAP